MDPVILAKDLYKCYPGFAPVLRGVSIEVQPGEMVAIMGPSGCGKSTMLHILGMLHAPDSGELEILGQNVLDLNSEQTAAFRRGNMGFVMQASNLFEHSTVFENVEFPLIYENVPPQERWERVIRALDLVRLSSRVHYRSNRLSGGEQQRVAIARAMVNNPRILLADEPTGALDSRTSVVIMENFRSLCHNGGVAMVMVTHDPRMAEYCDSIYTLEEGRLVCKKHEPPKVAAGSSGDFLRAPEPLVRGALVAWRFPAPENYNILELARRLHGQGLLSRIYALCQNGLFSGQAGYSLPLAVRRMGPWRRLFGSRLRINDAGASISALRQELSRTTGKTRPVWLRQAFSAGSVIADWCAGDNIEFLYATGARKVAAATWGAARVLAVPFAFAIRPEDMPDPGEDCRIRARDAAFVTCGTEAIAEAFRKFAPDVPEEKILILPNPPRFASAEEEEAAGVPAAPDKPLEILAMAPGSNRSAFAILLKALQLLKRKGVKFQLTVLGKIGFFLRWRLFWSGLRRQVLSGRQDDRIAENFRSADLFIAWPPAEPGMELAMPWPLCEAMCFGIPIIALGISAGMKPLKANENCIAAGTPEDIAKAAANIKDESALKLGESAKKDIRAWLDLAAKTKQLTDRIITAAASGDREKAQGNGL